MSLPGFRKLVWRLFLNIYNATTKQHVSEYKVQQYTQAIYTNTNSFPIFTWKEIETKRIRKEIKTIISHLNHILSFLSNI